MFYTYTFTGVLPPAELHNWHHSVIYPASSDPFTCILLWNILVYLQQGALLTGADLTASRPIMINSEQCYL